MPASAGMGKWGNTMLNYERIDSSPSGTTLMTTTAQGKSRAVDVDEWLYRANRVRQFTPDVTTSYVPRHRAAS